MASTQGTKQLRKLLASEAKTDAKSLQRAQQAVDKAEKAYQKSLKETQDAQKQLELFAKEQQKTAEALERALKKHNDAMNKLDKAEQTAKEARDQETRLEQEVGSYQDCLTNVHCNKIINDEDRERQKTAAYIKARQDQVSHETTSPGGMGDSSTV